MPKNITELPEETLLRIMSFLGSRANALALSRTNKLFNRLSKDTSLEPDFTRPEAALDLNIRNPSAIALSNNTNTLAVARSGCHHIDLINLDTHKIQTLKNVFDGDTLRTKVNLDFTPDGKHLIISAYLQARLIFSGDMEFGDVYSSGENYLAVVNVATGDKTLSCKDIGNEGSKPSLPQIVGLSDHSFLVGLQHQYPSVKAPNHPLYICDIPNQSITPLNVFDKALRYHRMCVSPDHKKIAMVMAAESSPSLLNIYNLENKCSKTIDLYDELMKKGCSANNVNNKMAMLFLPDNVTILAIDSDNMFSIQTKTGVITKIPVVIPNMYNFKMDDMCQLSADHIAINGKKFTSTICQTIIWNTQDNKYSSIMPFGCESIVWDNKRDQLITIKNGDVMYVNKVYSIAFPYQLQNQMEQQAENTLRMKR